jgi:uncharacterized protein (TIGR02118 family)
MAEIQPGIVRMGMIKRLETLTPEAFRDHWKGPHGAIAAKIPNLRRYHQNHVVESFRVDEWPDIWSLDGLSELWFDDLDTMLMSVASAGYAPLARDTPTVMTMPGLIAGVREKELASVGDAGAWAKAMMIVGRRSEATDAAFAKVWRKACPNLRTLDGVRQIVTVYVNHRESEPARITPYERLPVDIVCELWFATPTERRAALGDALVRHLGEDVTALTANVSCYAMQTYVIVP